MTSVSTSSPGMTTALPSTITGRSPSRSWHRLGTDTRAVRRYARCGWRVAGGPSSPPWVGTWGETQLKSEAEPGPERGPRFRGAAGAPPPGLPPSRRRTCQDVSRMDELAGDGSRGGDIRIGEHDLRFRRAHPAPE